MLNLGGFIIDLCVVKGSNKDYIYLDYITMAKTNYKVRCS